MTARAAVLVFLLIAAMAAGCWVMSGPLAGSPQRAALTAFCREVTPENAGYPKRGAALRARAWLTTAPGQQNGVDLFVDLSDAVISPERLIAPADLGETLRRIRGLVWNPAASAWQAGGRSVPLKEVRSLLLAALPTATDAEAVIDLLVGTPAPGSPDVRNLLTADPSRLTALRIVSFTGDRGQLLIDHGKSAYTQVERGYTGLLLAIDASGIDGAWRIVRLRSVAP